jgi:chromosome segregation ATPase
MPKISLGKTLLDWHSTVEGLAEDPALDQPHLRELGSQLAAYAAAVKELADEQMGLEGRRRAITQQLRITRRKGEEVAIKLRHAIQSVMGHSSAALTRFRVRPIRRHTRVNEETGIAVYPRPDLLVPPPASDSSEGN